MKLSEIFDGGVHQMEPGEHFDNTPLVILTLEEGEEEEPLDPYETPSMVAMIEETGSSYFVTRDQEYSMGWGSFCLSMTALVQLLEGERRQYQHNHYENAGRMFSGSTFTFQYLPRGGWEGGRL